MGVEPKIGVFTPKMDGENNGSKPYQNGMIWGVFPLFLVGNTHMLIQKQTSPALIFSNADINKT